MIKSADILTAVRDHKPVVHHLTNWVTIYDCAAVVKALGITGLRIGPEIDPGVPWTVGISKDVSQKPLALALKSGNFGTPDFFLKAWSKLAS